MSNENFPMPGDGQYAGVECRLIGSGLFRFLDPRPSSSKILAILRAKWVSITVFVGELRPSRRWLALAIVVGVTSGLAASVFYFLMNILRRLLLAAVGGVHVATLSSDRGGAHGLVHSPHPWFVPFVVALGAVASASLVHRYTGQTNGGGTNGAIEAIHDDPASVGLGQTLARMLGAALTIGSGGSSGSEGPAGQAGAGFASVISRRCRLSPEDAHVLAIAGLSSCVGAIFRAPLGGAFLGAEIVYRRDIASNAIVPSLISSSVAYVIFGSIYGFEPMFGESLHYSFGGAPDVVTFALVGLACGLLGRMYVASFYKTTEWFKRWPVRRFTAPAAAGLAVGTLGIWVPGVLGTGYGVVQQSLSRQEVLSVPLWMLVLIPFAKIAATSLTMGSGAPGGIFGPGLVIGGTAGAAVWCVLERAGIPSNDPAVFVMVGMAACLGSIAHAPIAVLLMAVETTDNLSFLVPPMIAVAIASLVVGEETLFRSQRADRRSSPTGNRCLE